MAITAISLISPSGPLDPADFPGESSKALEARVEAYLTAAYADPHVVAVTDDDAKQDRMASALALYAAYMAMYKRMLREPLTVNIAEKGSHGYSTAQIQGVKQLADDQMALFEDELPLEDLDPAGRWGAGFAFRGS